MTATLWISQRLCRILIRDSEGRIIDTNSEWNNRASAESWVYEFYPEATVQFSADPAAKRDLDQEWSACVTGA
jgi:hypothetical protein